VDRDSGGVRPDSAAPRAVETSPRLPLQAQERDLSFPRLVSPLVRRWRLVARTALIVVVASLLLAFLLPTRYTAETTFTTEQEQSGLSLPSGLAGLAGQLGISLTGMQHGLAPEFFVSVLKSREILGDILESSFPDSLPGGRGIESRRLIDVLDVKAPTQAKRFERSLKLLRKRVSASLDRKSGVLTLDVKDGSSLRAAAIANRLLELLNRYNVERLQSESREQRQFVEQRLAEAQQELGAAEEKQVGFLQTNRAYTQSPLLAYQAARLQRAVQLKQEVVVTLTKAYEEARISEARSIPVLVVVDSAVPPAYRSSPQRGLILLGGLALGLLLGAGLALAIGASRSPDGGADDDRAELQAAWASMRQDLRTLLRLRRQPGATPTSNPEKSEEWESAPKTNG